jgi:hypothetical protein
LSRIIDFFKIEIEDKRKTQCSKPICRLFKHSVTLM